MSGQTSELLIAQDKAEPSQLKQEANRCKLELLTQKELLLGSVSRFKKNLRNFRFLEENGISTQKLAGQTGESYDKLCSELNQLVEDWSRYIRLAVISKDPQPESDADREILKIEIEDQTKQIDKYKEMVDQLKFENLDIFTKIENSFTACQEKHTIIRENGLKPELRPPPPDGQYNFYRNKGIYKKLFKLH